MSETMLHIVLVEDDEVDVMNVARAFAKNKIASPLHVASNGLEGLSRLRDGTVPEDRRLVLLDINMPKMNGIEFLQALRADEALRSTSVVVLTSSNEDRDKMAARAMNVAGYLLKPLELGALVDLVATLNKRWTLVEVP